MTDAAAGGAALRAEGLVRAFDGDPVLHGVSLRVDPGELVTITGPSGSGKSTLLNILAGLDRPDAGHVFIDDVCVSELRRPVALRRHVVGFVFQLHHLLPTLSAHANVELPLIAARVRHAERHRRALAALEQVGLSGFAERRPGQLSGGERQRVAIARALVHRPRLLLADEPTGSLDRRTAELVADALARIRASDGTTMVVVSHDPELGGRADRSLVLDGGRFVDGRVASAPAVTPAMDRR